LQHASRGDLLRESHTAFYRFDDVHAKDFQSHFRVLRGGEPLGAINAERARAA